MSAPRSQPAQGRRTGRREGRFAPAPRSAQSHRRPVRPAATTWIACPAEKLNRREGPPQNERQGRPAADECAEGLRQVRRGRRESRCPWAWRAAAADPRCRYRTGTSRRGSSSRHRPPRQRRTRPVLSPRDDRHRRLPAQSPYQPRRAAARRRDAALPRGSRRHAPVRRVSEPSRGYRRAPRATRPSLSASRHVPHSRVTLPVLVRGPPRLFARAGDIPATTAARPRSLARQAREHLHGGLVRRLALEGIGRPYQGRRILESAAGGDKLFIGHPGRRR